MYFDDDDNRFLNPEILHVVHGELYAITSNLEIAPYCMRTAIPTHTEDGIPIRKLYVSNLPPKTTRTELFNVFAQYGFIKSCWLRMGDRGPNKPPTPTYAFVTYSNPEDAHKALEAPSHEKILRGRNLRISPADSWHQPAEDADGRVRWKPRGQRHDDESSPASNSTDPPDGPTAESSSYNEEANNTDENATNIEDETEATEDSYNIMDILNRDCMLHILTFVPVKDLIRSERVSKTWQNMVLEYLHSIRTFKTSWWAHEPRRLTTAVLRRVLQRLGGGLTRLHIDYHLSALNDRTAHTVGKFCPNLEELKVVGMYTKNWNPLLYGCKQLKNLSFVSCNKLTDSSLVHLVKNDSSIEVLTVANNTHVTGLFLTGSNTPKLHSLSFYNCYSLQGTVLCAAMDTLPNLTVLKLDVGPVTLWKIIPLILKKLPKLVELSISEYMSAEIGYSPQYNDVFCESLAHLTELRTLNMCRNIYINNAVLRQVGQTCTKLESLNISSCNSTRSFSNIAGVTDEGVRLVCAGCAALSRLDVSYLAALTDAGVRAAARLPRLRRLLARGAAGISAEPFGDVLLACHQLQEIDVCGCDNVSEAMISLAAAALAARPHPQALVLWLGGTAAAMQDALTLEECPSHINLTVNMHEDRSNPNLRPDFVDHIFNYSSDDSLDDIYDHELYEDLDEFLGADDDLLLDHDDEELHDLYAYGLHAADIILL